MMKTLLTARKANYGIRRMTALLLIACVVLTMAPMAALAAHTVLDASVTHVIVTSDTSLGKSIDCKTAVGTAKTGAALELYSQTTMTASDGAEWFQVKYPSDPNGYALLKQSAARAATAEELTAIKGGTYTGGTAATPPPAATTYKYAKTSAVNVVLRLGAGGTRSGKVIAAKGTTVQVLDSATVGTVNWTQIHYNKTLYWVQSQYLTMLSEAENSAYYAANPSSVYVAPAPAPAAPSVPAPATPTTARFAKTNTVNVVLRLSAGGERSGRLISAKETVVQVLNSATVSSVEWTQIYHDGLLYWVQSKYLTLMTEADSAAYAAANPTKVYSGLPTSGGAASPAGTAGTL